MPNPPTHIAIAARAAQAVGDATLRANMGAYLLGSTAPDIRVITRESRETYHFAPLNFQEVGEGAAALLAAHPELANAAGDATRCFTAGYISHLALDERWIASMYRPLFSERGLFASAARGNVMDRAMQLDLDRMSQPALPELREQLSASSDGVEMPFISTGELDAWRGWVTDFLDRGFSWERLRFMAGRVSRRDGLPEAEGIADDFLANPQQSIKALREAVGQDRLERFRSDATNEVAQRVAEYMR